MHNKTDQKNGSKALLVVSFGTTSAESRRLNIDAVEQAIADAAGSEWIIRRSFTSQMIINIIAKKEGVHIDNIKEALERAASGGVTELVVQPTHLMKGLEYDKLCDAVAEYEDRFEKVSVGDPLLTSEDDLERAAGALIGTSADREDGHTAFVFMGHGTGAASNAVYEKIQKVLTAKGKTDYFIGTVEARPSLNDVLDAVDKGGYTKVILRPFMLVAGNHALNDMASPDDPDSWYSRFTSAGYDTECVIEGLGQIASVRAMYADHAYSAIASLEAEL